MLEKYQETQKSIEDYENVLEEKKRSYCFKSGS
jgi:hypothetical protein